MGCLILGVILQYMFLLLLSQRDKTYKLEIKIYCDVMLNRTPVYFEMVELLLTQSIRI